MSARSKWTTTLGWIVSALAVGVPYFFVPYRELNLPNALYGPGLGVLVAAAAMTRVCGVATFWRGVVILGASVPGIILLRVAVDTATDPTSHNLWPFEIIVGSIVGFLCAWAGSLIGWIIARFRGREGSGA